MDALSRTACDTLLKDCLPRLRQALEELVAKPLDEQAPDANLQNLAAEARELLALFMGKESLASTTNQALTDDQTTEILSGTMSVEVIEPKPDTADTEPVAITDDEAMRLLAEMDAPDATALATPSTEISDDEAMKLLAEMDAPAAPEASENLNPAPPIEASAEDEAMRMLLEMEGGAAAAEAPQPIEPKAAPIALSQTEPMDVEEIDEWRANEFQSDPEMLKDFLTSTDELMESLDGTILQLEQDPNNKEVIESIFRAAHTLKGASGMFGFAAIERVMHRMENIFDQVRKGQMSPNADIIDCVFQGIDILKSLLNAVKAGKPCGIKTAPIVHALTLVAQGKKSPLARAGANSAAKKEEPQTAAATQTAEPAPTHDAPKPAADSSKDAPKEQSTIRVDLGRLDSLVNLVGELVIDRTRFATIEEELRLHHPQLKLTGDMTETVQLFGRHMNEIQDTIMKVRMVPIGNAFNKFPRLVRDLARTLGKQIELMTEGETTELDKTIVELIGDPLVHLVRNSCDHGIETPDERAKTRKPRTGKVFLSARQEGNQIVITIEDDGKGMDPERIRQKAIEKGLIKADDTLSQSDILNLIFEPGFSTAEKVTTVSGRGVGMDVVKKQISKLKGMIDIESTVGKGSRISIHLPLTLAIVQSLLVQAQDDKFAIPLNAVVESIRINPTEIQRVGDAEVIKLRNRVLPLIHLDQALALTHRKDHISYEMKDPSNSAARPQHIRANRRGDRLFVVVVGSAERRFGIVVDQLLTQQEMVIKNMGPMMQDIPSVAGGAVLGNGEVVLVLDIADLEFEFRKNRLHNSAAA